MQYVTWAELIYIQLLTPNASFLGHLAGILAGMLHLAVLQHLPMLRSGPTPFTGQGHYAHAPNADPDATVDIALLLCCPALPCPALPCPALPCPALPCRLHMPCYTALSSCPFPTL